MHRTVVASAIALALTGCSGMATKVELDASQLEQQNARLAKEVGAVTGLARSAQAVVIEDGLFVGRQSVKITNEPALPKQFSEETWFDAEVADLREFAERITQRTGIPTSVTPDAFAVWVAQETAKNSINLGNGTTALPGLPPVPGTLPAVGSTSATSTGVQPIKFSYSRGSLKGLLDMAAARYGVAWRYAKGEVQFYAYDTRTFFIRAVPGSSALQATVSSQANGGSGTSSSSSQTATTNTQTTSVSSELSVWTSIHEAIEAMLSKEGKVVIAPATGSVTVTDTPEVLKRVESFVEAQNAMLSKQVMITVQVLQVTRENSDDYSISWDLVYQDLFRSYGLTNTVTPANGAASLSLGIISPSSKWNGSTALINALSKQGTVNLETTTSVVALNNQPAPIQTGKQVTYVASSSTTVTSDVGTTTQITPGSVNTGYSMHVLPSIQADGSLFLQFSASISTLRTLRQITSGNTLIEAPEIDAKSFLQRVKMKSGETLVLSGFEQADGNVTFSGVGHAKMPLLGGGMKAGRNKDSLVVLLTPIVTSN